MHSTPSSTHLNLTRSKLIRVYYFNNLGVHFLPFTLNGLAEPFIYVIGHNFVFVGVVSSLIVCFSKLCFQALWASMAGFLSAVRRLYLATYNWVVCAGWLQVLYFALNTLRESSPTAVYGAVEKPLQFAQTAAILEIFHGLVGLVRSPISATLPQIGSRLFVTWGILHSFPEVRTSWLVSSLVISWSVTEIIRYSFFGLKETFGYTPSWLQWLRYSTFFVMYPTGISSEVGLIYTALPYIKNSDLYCLRMPNKLNFSFDYFYASLLVLAIYVPGSPHMYTYMIGQRKKALSKSRKSD